uniref:IF rod domain-containing protein n=1 Tax=Ciona savignyi TaxID=51511 RepID=H2ZA20_CIOSA
MASKPGRSSYRNTFGSQTAYSTAGSKSYSKGFGIEEPITAKRVSYSYSASSSGGATGPVLDFSGLKLNVEDMEKVRSDINDYRKQVTQLEMELESLRGTNEYLERNLADVEKRYEVEAARYQTRVVQLGSEFDHAQAEMKRHLAEYKRLMSAKISLEKEILTYRRLLEGEEKRSSSSSSSSEDDDDDAYKTKTTKKVIVKTIETRDGKIVSSSISEKQLLEDRSDADTSSSSSSSSDEE